VSYDAKIHRQASFQSVATLGLTLGYQEKKILSWSYKTKAIEQTSFSEASSPPCGHKMLCVVSNPQVSLPCLQSPAPGLPTEPNRSISQPNIPFHVLCHLHPCV